MVGVVPPPGVKFARGRETDLLNVVQQRLSLSVYVTPADFIL